MTIVIDFRRLFFWRRISALEKRIAELQADNERFTLAVGKVLADLDKLNKQFTQYLITGKKEEKPPVLKLRGQSEVNAFLGENYDAPS